MVFTQIWCDFHPKLDEEQKIRKEKVFTQICSNISPKIRCKAKKIKGFHSNLAPLFANKLGAGLNTPLGAIPKLNTES